MSGVFSSGTVYLINNAAPMYCVEAVLAKDLQVAMIGKGEDRRKDILRKRR